jgi:hypothetical protein
MIEQTPSRDGSMLTAMLMGIGIDIFLSTASLMVTVFLKLGSPDIPAGIVVAFLINWPGFKIAEILFPGDSEGQVFRCGVAAVAMSGAMYGFLWEKNQRRIRAMKAASPKGRRPM